MICLFLAPLLLSLRFSCCPGSVGLGEGCSVGKVRLNCCAASQEVWLSRPPIGKQNNCRFRGFREVRQARAHSKAREHRVRSQHSVHCSALPLPACLAPLSHLDACLPLLRWPNNSLLSVDCLETTCLQPKSCCVPGCQEEVIPSTEALKDRAAFFLPESSPSLPNSDGMLSVEKLVPHGGRFLNHWSQSGWNP